MAKLSDLVKHGIPCEVVSRGTRYQWDGHNLLHNGNEQYAGAEVLLDDRWSLYEPSIEDVCKEAGFGYIDDHLLGYHSTHKSIWCPRNTPIAKVKKIIEFAKEMKKC